MRRSVCEEEFAFVRSCVFVTSVCVCVCDECVCVEGKGVLCCPWLCG